MYRCFQIVNRFPHADFRTLAVHSGLCCGDSSRSLIFVAAVDLVRVGGICAISALCAVWVECAP
jgi:hypothetical protein